MAKRRKVTHVTLTTAQRRRLEDLWFYFGNYGPETTPGNHSFIQRMLEQGIDERPLFSKRTPKYKRPTEKCERAVEAILSPRADAEAPGKEKGVGGLRAISSHATPKPQGNPELKAMLDDLNRRYSVQRQRLDDIDDTPDAA